MLIKWKFSNGKYLLICSVTSSIVQVNKHTHVEQFFRIALSIALDLHLKRTCRIIFEAYLFFFFFKFPLWRHVFLHANFFMFSTIFPYPVSLSSLKGCYKYLSDKRRRVKKENGWKFLTARCLVKSRRNLLTLIRGNEGRVEKKGKKKSASCKRKINGVYLVKI